MMAKWIDIGPAEDFPPGCKVCTKVEGKAIVVMNVAGRLFAVSNVCPHAGLPLGDGELAGKVLTCPYHGYAYNIETGCNIDFPKEEAPVPRYEVKCEAGRVAVGIEE